MKDTHWKQLLPPDVEKQASIAECGDSAFLAQYQILAFLPYGCDSFQYT